MAWDKNLWQLIEREAEIVDDSFFDAACGLPDEDNHVEVKKRGRPKGILENVPRKRKINVNQILSRLEEAIRNLRRDKNVSI